MRILVTGASGLLGINLALEAAKSHQVFGTVHRHALNTKAFSVIHSDLLARVAIEQLLDQTRPDWVIHCAALANLDACESNPELAVKLNTEVPGKLAACVARGGARLLHVSTDAVFDGQRGNYTEEDPPNPLSVYARTKLEGERSVAKANPEAIIARVNLIGWSLAGNRSLAEFFYYNLRAGQKVKGFIDVYFCPLLANDLATIFLEMLSKGLRGLYHVVSSECISKYEFGVAVARKFGLDGSLIEPSTVALGNLKAARSSRLVLRSDKLARDLGRGTPSWKDGLERFYRLYKKGYPQLLQSMIKL